jgi:hypothetical protein
VQKTFSMNLSAKRQNDFLVTREDRFEATGHAK